MKPNKKGRKKKPGRKPGHEGTSRKKPEHFDKTENLAEDRCPECGKKLSDKNDIRTWEHYQEDFVPAHREVTRFIHHDRRCPKCRSEVKSPPGENEIPKSRLGPKLLVYGVLLHYYHRLPFRKTAEILKESCGIRVSAGALSQMAGRLAKKLSREFEEILRQIRAAPVLNVDETGWRTSGINHWLWVFADKLSTVYFIDRRRSGKVVDDVLGEDYDGVITSDFHGLYNRHDAKKAKCWAHLLREFHEVAEDNNSREFLGMYKRIKRLWHDARRLWSERANLGEEVYSRRLGKIEKRMSEMALREYSDGQAIRLSKRLKKHGDSLLTFIRVEGVDPTNNKAERELRPSVIMRKTSGGSRSPEGANAYSLITSLISTCRARGRSFMEYAAEALRHHLDGKPGTIIHNLKPVTISNN